MLGLVHWDDPEGWYGEGGGRGVQDGECVPRGGNHVVFLELRRHSRVTTGISAFPLGWPWVYWCWFVIRSTVKGLSYHPVHISCTFSESSMC